MNKVFDVNDIDGMYVDNTEVTDGMVDVVSDISDEIAD